MFGNLLGCFIYQEDNKKYIVFIHIFTFFLLHFLPSVPSRTSLYSTYFLFKEILLAMLREDLLVPNSPNFSSSKNYLIFPHFAVWQFARYKISEESSFLSTLEQCYDNFFGLYILWLKVFFSYKCDFFLVGFKIVSFSLSILFRSLTIMWLFFLKFN